MKINGVICYWKFDKEWILSESFGVDDDGRSVSPTSTGGDRYEWNKWIHEYDEEGEQIGELKGRAVTYFTLGYDVKLIAFHPPEWVDWLSHEFYEKIELPFLKDGYMLRFRTVEEAKKIMFGE